MRHEPTVVPIARRLRRLRWLMALAFAMASVGGLAILAAVALHVDGRSRADAELAEVKRRVTAAADLVYSDDSPDDGQDGGRLELQWLAEDDASDGHPEVYVVTRGVNHLSVVYAGRNRRHDVADTWLLAAAQDALTTESDQVSNVRDTRGHHVYLLARPLYADAQSDAPSGAVIAVGDPRAGRRAHHQLLWALLASIGGLAAASTAVGFVLSGYAVRPVLANLTAQERFLADAAHELRTPVAALQASAEASLAEGSGSAEPGAVDPTVVVRHTRRLGGVIDALLTRARLAAGVQSARREPLRLDLLVEDEAADMGLDPAEVVEHADEVVVRADPTLVRLAVRNLLDNAVRHGHRPGEPARVRVTVAAGMVRVGDSGPGVSGDLLRGGFGRYRGDPGGAGRGGSGLGVSIANEVARAHGGRLEAANDPAGGAVFTLRLP